MAIHLACTIETEDRAAAEEAVRQALASVGPCRRGGPDVLLAPVCPHADVKIRFRQRRLEVALQGTPAGPGAHAAGARVIDTLLALTGGRGRVDDPTGYFMHRDFDRLCREDYYPWLATAARSVRRRYREIGPGACSLGWHPDHYRPQVRLECVVTPLGPFHVEELTERVQPENIAAFAEEFFVRPHDREDALALRNSALSRLWKDCRFVPSAQTRRDSEINGTILRELEAAAALDPTLPFPKRAYLEVCGLHGHPAMPLDHLPEYDLFADIGYRKGLVRYVLGNQALRVPGHFLVSEDAKSIRFSDDSPDGWRRVTIWPVPVDGLVLHFDLEFFSNAVEPLDIQGIEGGGRSCFGFMGRRRNRKTGCLEYTAQAQVISPRLVNFFQFAFSRPEDRLWAAELVHAVTVLEGDGLRDVN